MELDVRESIKVVFIRLSNFEFQVFITDNSQLPFKGIILASWSCKYPLQAFRNCLWKITLKIFHLMLN